MDEPPYDTPEGKRASKRLNLVLEYGLSGIAGIVIGNALFDLSGAAVGALIGVIIMFALRARKADGQTVWELWHTLEYLGLVIILAALVILVLYGLACT